MFQEELAYLQNRVQQGIPWLDDDDNDYQQSFCNQVRRVEQILGDGTSNNGFLLLGTGANNDVTVKGGDGTAEGAGRLWVRGFGCALFNDTTFANVGANESSKSIHPRITNLIYDSGLSQTALTDSAANWVVNELAGKTVTPNITRPASTFTVVSNTRTQMTLSGDATQAAEIGDNYRVEMRPTLGGSRIDYVYVNVYLDEYDATDDPNLIHQLTVPTVAQLREKLIHTIYVREGADTLTDYVDSDGNQHWVMKIAEITRTTSAAIGALDVVDRRPVFFGDYSDLPLTKVYAVDTGAAWLTYAGFNTFDARPAPGFVNVGQIVAGITVNVQSSGTNTLPMQLLLNGFGPYPIKKNGGTTPLAPQDVSTGEIITMVFDGTVFQTGGGIPGQWDLSGNDIYYTAGNVGVGGTPAAGYSLDIQGKGRFVSAGSAAGSGGVIIRDASGDTDVNYLQFVNNAGTSLYGGIRGVKTGASGGLAFLVGSTEGARLTSTGLGIGKTPSVPLDVVGAIAGTGSISTTSGAISTANGAIYTTSGAVYTTSGDVYTSSGNIYTSSGTLSATGNITTSAGDLVATAGNVSATSGTLIGSALRVTTGAASGAVLVSDGAGNASWTYPPGTILARALIDAVTAGITHGINAASYSYSGVGFTHRLTFTTPLASADYFVRLTVGTTLPSGTFSLAMQVDTKTTNYIEFSGNANGTSAIDNTVSYYAQIYLEITT